MITNVEIWNHVFWKVIPGKNVLFLLFISYLWVFDRTNHVDWCRVRETAAKTASEQYVADENGAIYDF